MSTRIECEYHKMNTADRTATRQAEAPSQRFGGLSSEGEA